eukprot:5697817-Alexandrium_andersonii.AAC.1
MEVAPHWTVQPHQQAVGACPSEQRHRSNLHPPVLLVLALGTGKASRCPAPAEPERPQSLGIAETGRQSLGRLGHSLA